MWAALYTSTMWFTSAELPFPGEDEDKDYSDEPWIRKHLIHQHLIQHLKFKFYFLHLDLLITPYP